MGRVIFKICLFIILIVILASNANSYVAGDEATIWFVVPDSLTGKPTNSDSIFITIYDSMSTTIVVSKTAMTKWNSQTGQYYYVFATPAGTAKTYSAQIQWFQYESDIPYILWRNIKVTLGDVLTTAEHTSITSDIINFTPGDTTTNKFGAVLLRNTDPTTIRNDIINSNTSDTTTNKFGATLLRNTNPDNFLDSTGLVNTFNTSYVRYFLDSLSVALGMTVNGFSKTAYYTDVDSVFAGYYHDAIWDTLRVIIYFHPGKGLGAAPDSTQTIAW